jgi:predicted nucleotidyltransferase
MRLAELSIDHDELVTLCQRYGIARLEVFGSFARGEARPDSDVDVLVTFVPGRVVGMDFFLLPAALAGIFHREVDVLTRRTVENDANPVFRQSVLSHTEVIYDAAA